MSPPTAQATEVHRHTIIREGAGPYASREEVQNLADRVTDLQGTIQQHDEHAQHLVAQALATMLEKLPAALEEATERAMRRVMTDKALHTQVGASILDQARDNVHRAGGRWLFSKWAALALLAIAAAQYIGWPAALKALFSLGK